MGQYYNILTNQNNEYKVYDRSIKRENEEPEYMLAKIMEHSWLYNDTMQSFSNVIYQNPTKVAWVGDYADECDEDDLHNENLSLETALNLHEIAWNSEEDYLNYSDFDTENMLLVNWDKKQYVKMQEYIDNNTCDGWCIHPSSLLTAIGNGFGGGDYRGINLEDVGIWAYDTISFENLTDKNKFIENGFDKLFLEFNEQ